MLRERALARGPRTFWSANVILMLDAIFSELSDSYLLMSSSQWWYIWRTLVDFSGFHSVGVMICLRSVTTRVWADPCIGDGHLTPDFETSDYIWVRTRSSHDATNHDVGVAWRWVKQNIPEKVVCFHECWHSWWPSFRWVHRFLLELRLQDLDLPHHRHLTRDLLSLSSLFLIWSSSSDRTPSMKTFFVMTSLWPVIAVKDRDELLIVSDWEIREQLFWPREIWGFDTIEWCWWWWESLDWALDHWWTSWWSDSSWSFELQWYLSSLDDDDDVM